MKPIAITLLRALALGAALGFTTARAEDVAEPKKESNLEGSVTTVGTYTHVDGDERQYREHWWREDGLSGGIEEFTLRQQLNETTDFSAEGHALFDEEDYGLVLQLRKKELGFIRVGGSQFQKWYDNTGGYYPLFSKRSFDIEKETEMEMGRIFFEAGLTLPDAPVIILAYEHQYKKGRKSMIEWGSVTETLTAPPQPVGSLPLGSITKKIFPATKEIDESVDIVRLSISHQIGEVRLMDEFTYERYYNHTKRLDDAQRNLTTLATKNVTVKEDFYHDAFSNVFSLDSHINEKTYFSAGYLFSTLNGDAEIRINTVPFDAVRDKSWVANNIDLSQDSHVMNLNLMIGPFKGLVGNVGVQAERTDTESAARGILTEIANGPVVVNPLAQIRTENEDSRIEEIVGLRFTSIPFTTLYAEGRWGQSDIDLREREFEDGNLDGASAFRRFTDTTGCRQTYTVGFNSSPIRKVTVGARYRRTLVDTDYDHEVDTKTTAGVPTAVEGYSAFIRKQEFDTDEITARLTLRPCSRLSLTFRYGLIATDIETRNDAVPSLGIPRGGVGSGNFDSSVYSVSATVTPINRLYVTQMISYEDTRTISHDHQAHSVITYEGDVYAFITAVGLVLDKKTDITAEYSFTYTENFENNGSDNTPTPGFGNNDYGLPLGLDSEKHGMVVTLVRRISENIIARVRYGFYKYEEDSAVDVDDYTVHMGSLACTFRF